MSAKVSDEQLEMVRRWASYGVDLNGIQKNLATECGVHMTYMDVRFLLLDHGIEIARPQPKPAPEPAPAPAAAPTPAPAPAPAAPAPEPGASVKPKVTLDDLQLPGTLISGKCEFPSGTNGSWQIDQMGRFGWSALSGTPTPVELQAFEMELRQILSRMS
ncbi:MAG: hypothetical protein II295_01020 [Akkermansia sp.]|nr:hypothetical protein [Akkermansia sp.]